MAGTFLALNGTGQNDVASGTLTFTTTRQINAGEHVVVCAAEAGGGDIPTGITVGSLSLTNRVSDSTVRDISIWSAVAIANIASASTVTVTYSVTPSTRMAACLSLSGVDVTIAATDINTFASGTAHNAGPTASVGAGCVMVAAIHLGTAGTTIVPGGGYTERVEIDDPAIGTMFQVETLDSVGAGTQTASWTSGVTSDSGCAIVVFNPFVSILVARSRRAGG